MCNASNNMKYSIVNEKKVVPYPKGKGICPVCGSSTQAKCGTRKVWHWAHISTEHCDSWWENETEWHRKWKSLYPEEWQEVVMFDNLTGEKHIADVRTNDDLVIEFQNSPMSLEELFSRENFYQNMLWIINGKNFIENFHILHMLPDPNCDFVQDIVFHARKYNHLGKLFHRKSETYNLGDSSSFRIRSVESIKSEIENHYVGHHLFHWVKPRSVWYESKMKVFFDFGDELLWNLLRYDDRGLHCIQAISKRNFVNETGGNYVLI